MRGEKYAYVFQAKPYGTHFYHCHFGTSMHMQAGMYGAFIVERPDDPIRQKFPYTQDYIYLLSSIDPRTTLVDLQYLGRDHFIASCFLETDAGVAVVETISASPGGRQAPGGARALGHPPAHSFRT